MAAQWRPAGVGAERSSAMRLCNDQEGPTAPTWFITHSSNTYFHYLFLLDAGAYVSGFFSHLFV